MARIRIDGMHCGSCTALVEETLLDTEGVHSATVDLTSGMAEVTFDPSVVQLEALVAAVTDAGYAAQPVG